MPGSGAGRSQGCDRDVTGTWRQSARTCGGHARDVERGVSHMPATKHARWSILWIGCPPLSSATYLNKNLGFRHMAIVVRHFDLFIRWPN